MFAAVEGTRAHVLSAAGLLEAALEVLTSKKDLAGRSQI